MLTLILERHEERQELGFVDANTLIEAAAALRHPRGTVAWAELVEILDHMVHYPASYVSSLDEDECNLARIIAKLVYPN